MRHSFIIADKPFLLGRLAGESMGCGASHECSERSEAESAQIRWLSSAGQNQEKNERDDSASVETGGGSFRCS